MLQFIGFLLLNTSDQIQGENLIKNSSFFKLEFKHYKSLLDLLTHWYIAQND